MLDEQWFKEYGEAFSRAKDKSAFFDRYYDPEVTFIHPFKGTFHGKDALVTFWNAGKNAGHASVTFWEATAPVKLPARQCPRAG